MVFNMILDIHLSERCNLNCANCNHFSPIASEGFLDPKEFEESLGKIDTNVLHHFDCIHLIGGEPLLNKNINDIITIARKYYKKCIRIITNGILLGKMNDEFFRVCEENEIEIGISKYPINLDYHKLLASLNSKYPNIRIYFGHIVDRFKVYRFDVDGKQDINLNYKKCDLTTRLHCMQLVKCRLYNCFISAYIRHFNKRFGMNIKEDEEFLDLSQVKSVTELYDWYKRPKQFCKYCVLNDDFEPWRPYEKWNNDYL